MTDGIKFDYPEILKRAEHFFWCICHFFRLPTEMLGIRRVCKNPGKPRHLPVLVRAPSSSLLFLSVTVIIWLCASSGRVAVTEAAGTPGKLHEKLETISFGEDVGGEGLRGRGVFVT